MKIEFSQKCIRSMFKSEGGYKPRKRPDHETLFGVTLPSYKAYADDYLRYVHALPQEEQDKLSEPFLKRMEEISELKGKAQTHKIQATMREISHYLQPFNDGTGRTTEKPLKDLSPEKLGIVNGAKDFARYVLIDQHCIKKGFDAYPPGINGGMGIREAATEMSFMAGGVARPNWVIANAMKKCGFIARDEWNTAEFPRVSDPGASRKKTFQGHAPEGVPYITEEYAKAHPGVKANRWEFAPRYAERDMTKNLAERIKNLSPAEREKLTHEIINEFNDSYIGGIEKSHEKLYATYNEGWEKRIKGWHKLVGTLDADRKNVEKNPYSMQELTVQVMSHDTNSFAEKTPKDFRIHIEIPGKGIVKYLADSDKSSPTYFRSKGPATLPPGVKLIHPGEKMRINGEAMVAKDFTLVWENQKHAQFMLELNPVNNNLFAWANMRTDPLTGPFLATYPLMDGPYMDGPHLNKQKNGHIFINSNLHDPKTPHVTIESHDGKEKWASDISPPQSKKHHVAEVDKTELLPSPSTPPRALAQASFVNPVRSI